MDSDAYWTAPTVRMVGGQEEGSGGQEAGTGLYNWKWTSILWRVETLNKRRISTFIYLGHLDQPDPYDQYDKSDCA